MFPAYSVKARNSSFETRVLILDTRVLILKTRYSIEHNTPSYVTRNQAVNDGVAYSI